MKIKSHANVIQKPRNNIANQIIRENPNDLKYYIKGSIFYPIKRVVRRKDFSKFGLEMIKPN